MDKIMEEKVHKIKDVLLHKKFKIEDIDSSSKTVLKEIRYIYDIEIPICYFKWMDVKWIIGFDELSHDKEKGVFNRKLRIICTNTSRLAENLAEGLFDDINYRSDGKLSLLLPCSN